MFPWPRRDRRKVILLVGTSEGTLGHTQIRTGAWAETVAEPYLEFLDKNYIVDCASIAGGPLPIDPISLYSIHRYPRVNRFLADGRAQRALSATQPMAMVDPRMYSAMFIAGGHGIALDGPYDMELRRVVEGMYMDKKPIAAVEHGTCALVHACVREAGHPHQGKSILYDRQVTGVSNRTEVKLDRSSVVPFLLEDRIKQVGGRYVTTINEHVPCVVRSGQIITGQYPADSRLTAEALVEALSFGVRHMR